jgi:Coenzyme PQQ synthesis protein D (PqqD)
VTSQSPSAYEPNSPAVAGEIIDGEAIILHLPKGHYFSSEGSGAFIWSAVEKRIPVAEIENRLGAAYGIDSSRAADAVRSFVTTLSKHDLVRPCEAAPGGWEEIERPSGAFSTPTIEIYTDMQHLLLLDPIHDVDAVGWPIAPNPGGP